MVLQRFRVVFVVVLMVHSPILVPLEVGGVLPKTMESMLGLETYGILQAMYTDTLMSVRVLVHPFVVCETEKNMRPSTLNELIMNNSK
jgi:hypothetical protein